MNRNTEITHQSVDEIFEDISKKTEKLLSIGHVANRLVIFDTIEEATRAFEFSTEPDLVTVTKQRFYDDGSVCASVKTEYWRQQYADAASERQTFSIATIEETVMCDTKESFVEECVRRKLDDTPCLAVTITRLGKLTNDRMSIPLSKVDFDESGPTTAPSIFVADVSGLSKRQAIVAEAVLPVDFNTVFGDWYQIVFGNIAMDAMID